MKSKTKIEKQTKIKRNPELIKTIIKAKKKEKWMPIAELLSGPTRKRINVNLDKIEKESKEGDTIVVPGKVLSKGNITKKLKIVALSFSKASEEKLKKSNCEIVSVEEEIEKNPEAKGVKIIK